MYVSKYNKIIWWLYKMDIPHTSGVRIQTQEAPSTPLRHSSPNNGAALSLPNFRSKV